MSVQTELAEQDIKTLDDYFSILIEIEQDLDDKSVSANDA